LENQREIASVVLKFPNEILGFLQLISGKNLVDLQYQNGREIRRNTEMNKKKKKEKKKRK
jgi:hypothetical protein